MLAVTNKNDQDGKLADIVKGKDVFIGVSAPKMMTKEMVATMAEKSIVFAMANPTPEIFPDEAKEGGAFGIRANTKEDIKEIQSQVDLPIIGIVKRDYEDSDIYITPTMKEIDELMEAALSTAEVIEIQ